MNVDGTALAGDVFERVGVDEVSSEHLEKPALTYWADVWRRFRQNKLAVFGLGLLVIIIVMLFLGPALSGKDYQYIDSSIRNQKPSAEHWFGTDDLGRDMFTRVCYGGRVSILIGLLCTVVMIVIGFTMGGAKGRLG